MAKSTILTLRVDPRLPKAIKYYAGKNDPDFNRNKYIIGLIVTDLKIKKNKMRGK